MNSNYKISPLSTRSLGLENVNAITGLLHKLSPENALQVNSEIQKKYLKEPGVKIVVARANAGILKGLIVGMGTVSFLPRLRSRECHINDLVVADDHEGQGLMTEILQQLIIIAFGEFNADVITLMTTKEQQATFRIHERAGFRKSGTVNNFVLRRS